MNKIKENLYTTFLSILLLLFMGAGAAALAQDEVFYIHNDALGSPIAATDQAGNLVWRENYKPYGEKLIDSVTSDDNDVWYTGRPHDDETGLSFMGARFYDPVIGRFMGIDPVGFQESQVHSFNRYAHANNKPYK